MGSGAPLLALSASVLFLSNMLSLVFAGTSVFAALGYAALPVVVQITQGRHIDLERGSS